MKSALDSLKDGMLITFRNGKEYTYIEENFELAKGSRWNSKKTKQFIGFVDVGGRDSMILEEYHPNLNHKNNTEWDVVKVFKKHELSGIPFMEWSRNENTSKFPKIAKKSQGKKKVFIIDGQPYKYRRTHEKVTAKFKEVL